MAQPGPHRWLLTFRSRSPLESDVRRLRGVLGAKGTPPARRVRGVWVAPPAPRVRGRGGPPPPPGFTGPHRRGGALRTIPPGMAPLARRRHSAPRSAAVRRGHAVGNDRLGGTLHREDRASCAAAGPKGGERPHPSRG